MNRTSFIHQTGRLIIAVFFIIGPAVALQAQTVYKAFLSGSHEVSPVTSTAFGEVTVVRDGNTITLEGSFEGLSSPVATDIAGGAHIHLALPGSNGGVEFPLDVDLGMDGTAGSFAAEDNEFDLNEAQISALEERRLYVNVHTENYRPGEIRGQLHPESDYYFRANLSGTNEVPPVLTQAHGSVTAELAGNSLIVTGSFHDLTGDFTGAHIHRAVSGRNGGVEIPLNVETGDDERSGVLEAGQNTFELTPAQIEMFLERRFYINVHSNVNPGGEIRGQLVPQVTSTMIANLSGSAEESGIISEGSGSIAAELDGNMLTVTGSYQGLGSNFTASHLHVGLPGRSGGVSVGLNETPDTQNPSAGVYEAENNTFELSQDQIDLLMNRQLYINVHSQGYPGGEIRGQLLGESRAYFTARFAGIHEIPPVQSDGRGQAEIEFKGNRLVMAGSFSGLTDSYTASHFHIGAPYESGGVILGVMAATEGNETSGVYTASDNRYQEEITSEFVDLLFGGNLYLNIHSGAFPPGEIRGQVLPAPNNWPDAAPLVAPADEEVIVIEGDGTQVFEIAWNRASDPDGNTVVYIWQAADDDTFSDLLFNHPVGTDTLIQVSYAEADSFLLARGIDEGESFVMHHRTIATDGSLYRVGDSRTFEVVRGIVTGTGEDNELPQVTQLHQNYPNPFNPVTEITFLLAEQGPAELTVYNMLGQRVAVLLNETLSSGTHRVRFDASQLASGVYIYRLETGNSTQIRQMTLLR